MIIIFFARRQPYPQAAFRLGLSKTIKSINGFVEDGARFDRVTVNISCDFNYMSTKFTQSVSIALHSYRSRGAMD